MTSREKKPSRHRETGLGGEALAVSHLQKKGYEILARNYRCLFGEVDVIARDGNCVVFVEVKRRLSLRFGKPEEAIHVRKRKKISRTALYYLQERGWMDRNARFDVVVIRPGSDGEEIRLIRNAFEVCL